MDGKPDTQGELFYGTRLEQMIPADHPLREIRKRVDRLLPLTEVDFARAYGVTGRPSVPPEPSAKGDASPGVA